ncbi:hypothetical protein KJBENDCP_00020 [Klebsiella phage vB_KmiS-Kmi2C]|nr:hypothetical protein KJBENDCP_00020 [Klebsiella phage vB_KmiS-Kmi2C]
MKLNKKCKILFFVDGPAPSNKDFEAAENMKAHVVFRNARAVSDAESLEQCDGVAGMIPEIYKNKPSAEEAIKGFKKKVEEVINGDDNPPKVEEVKEVKTETKSTSKPAWGDKK